jgi:N-acetylglucosamine repressor
MRQIGFGKEELTEKEKRTIEIMEILRRRGPISRPEISKEMGINVVTISNYIDDFIKHDLVQEKELDVSEGGRPPALLDLNPEGGYIIGVGLNLMNMVGLLIDLKNNIVMKTQIDRPGASAREIAECVLEIIRGTIRRSKDYMKGIKGIGVGIAGIIDKKSGTVRWPERSGYNYTNYASINFPLKELIEKEFGLPVIIENDATAACFGEQRLQLEPGLKNIIYMFSGVGSGIMINGQVYTGSCGLAGELSVFNYKEEELFNCTMGSSCFLKRWDIDIGIVRDIKAALAKDDQAAARFFKAAATDSNSVDLKSVFAASRANDPLACSVLDSAAKRLGIRVAYLVNLLNPQIVVIGGGLEEAGEDFLNRVNLTVREWAFREATEDLRIFYSQLRENAVAMGAASLVMEKVFAGLL